MNPELSPLALLQQLRSLHLNNSELASQKSKGTNSKQKLLLAYSGGLDSHVLLHLLSQLPSDEFWIRAIYINHGLQQQSNDWATHCQHICDELHVSFATIDLNLKIPQGESLEEVARNARYAALISSLQQDEMLLTAHHQNDQAETLLLQLFRGAGVSGLAAMAQSCELTFNQTVYSHARPLLNYSRGDLEAYAKQHDLNVIEDPSNSDDAFNRNYLRNEIMPLLRQRWQGIDKAISRSASIQAETKQLLEEVAQQKLSSVLAKDAGHADDPAVLSPLIIPQLLKHDIKIQRLLLRYWISQQGFSHPSEKKLQHVFSDVIHSADDKQPLITWTGAELRRYQQQLYLMTPLTAHDASQIIPWDSRQPLKIASLNIKLDPKIINFDWDNISVRFRQGGESIAIAKRGNILLKNLFQELQIPPWMRSRLPLIYKGEKLVQIVGLDV